MHGRTGIYDSKYGSNHSKRKCEKQMLDVGRLGTTDGAKTN